MIIAFPIFPLANSKEDKVILVTHGKQLLPGTDKGGGVKGGLNSDRGGSKEHLNSDRGGGQGSI